MREQDENNGLELLQSASSAGGDTAGVRSGKRLSRDIGDNVVVPKRDKEMRGSSADTGEKAGE